MGKKIAIHRYGIVNLRMNNLNNNINTLIVTNISCALELGHNLLSTILLAQKGAEIFLKKASQL